jgi:hypothetical protein
LVKLDSNLDAPGVSACTNIVGGLLRYLFGVDVDSIFVLGGAIVLYNSTLQLKFLATLGSMLSTSFVLYGNANGKNFFPFDPSTSFIPGFPIVSKHIYA